MPGRHPWCTTSWRTRPTPARCDLSCQLPLTPGGWRRKAREGRSASRREDPIHLGAATRQREGAIRRAERRRQWAEAWEPRSGSALAETERLSASERPSKVRNRKTGPRGWWPGPKGQRVGSPDRATGDGDTNAGRTTGGSRPGRTSPLGQQGKPHSSRRKTEARPQGRVTAEGVEESRIKRTPSCNGADRARTSGGYPARKGADFRQVSAEAMDLDASTGRRR